MADTDGKKLTELRVIDLKTELERRGLDKTGNKAALLERLSKNDVFQAISEEGENPEEFLIVPCIGVNKISPPTGVASHDEPMDTHDSSKEECNDAQEGAETKSKEDSPPKVSEDEINSAKKQLNSEPQVILEDAMKKVVKPQESKAESSEKVNNEASEEVKESDNKDEEENSGNTETSESPALPAPAPPVVTPTTPAPTPAPLTNSSIEANGIDNEDSINLTIGEDEENLLAEETETHVRQKDGGAKKRNEDNKKVDTKGSSRADGGSSNKDVNSSNSNAGIKSKLDGGDGGKSGDSNNKGPKRDEKDKKTTQSSPANASSRNLWVSGLSSTTRATDLKQIFSKYGKVIGAKVVTNARTPGARCYGYVTMSTSEDAAKCIQHLHRTELHGRVISVEKAKGDSQQGHMRKRDSNNGKVEKKEEKDAKGKDGHESSEKKDKDVKKDVDEKGTETAKKTDEKGEGATDEKKIDGGTDKKEDPTKDADTRSTKSTSKKPESERGKRDDKRIRTWDHHRSHSRSRSRERRRRDDVLTFAKIREERERQRLRQREWLLREEERRRREDVERQREIERRQRDEAARLEREREKLRREREKIEQEKAELLRLERERQKLEREKLERERLELKRQQMRLEESRRAPPPPSIKRTSSDRRDPRDLYVEPDRKRIAAEHSRRHSPDRVADRRPEILDRVSDRRLDSSPPSRYDSTRSTQDLTLKKDFKRGTEFSSRSSRPETFPEVSRGREVIVRREALPTPSSSIDSRQVKERRYERPTTTTYGREREVRRSEPESHRSSRDSHARYTESSKPPGSSAPRESRYGDSNRAPSGWHSGPPSTKSFNSVQSSGPRDPRNEPSSWSSRSSDNVNRWSNSSSMGSGLRHPGPPMYQGGPIQSIGGLAAPGTAPSYDRFDPYKSSMPIRKY
ncbi:SAFB-like transcription modulator isoform X3 [Venturia canescens]|uniref:SAFB-like transcription modulator isoform X3 n=1 Tax=Venturia canescens TaxID=32260 RepID=UPI001C9C96FE|nr:SAFB-like transcription modulator isoform X3 [Venturia canescens]